MPHAGSGIGRYRALGALVPRSIEAWAMCLPGREQRIMEPAHETIGESVDDIRDALLELPGEPGWVLFGHSMGAVVAWELAAQIEPDLLVVSGCRGPDGPIIDAALLDLSDTELVAEMRRRFGGFPPAVEQYPELIDLTLPTLRADLGALAAYEPDDRALLKVPLTAYRGRTDAACSSEQIARWQGRTSGGFRVREFEGGHHYLFDRPREVVETLRADIGRPPASNGR